MTRSRAGLAAWVVRIGLAICYGLPLLWLLATSFKTGAQINRAPNSLTFVPTLDAYQAVANADLWAAAWSSFAISLSVTAIVVVLGVPAAYALSRTKTRWFAVVIGVLIALQMLPTAASVIPLYQIFGSWGIASTLLAAILADSAHLLPFGILLLRPFFLTVPHEIEEAAAVDGARLLRTFSSIVLPLARNGVLTVATLLFIITWGEFLYAITLLDPADYPLTALLSQQISQYGNRWNNLMALAVLSALPILLLFAATQRKLADGLALGSSK